MEKLSIILNQPEYLHVVLNHLPLTGLFIAILSLAIALLTKNRSAILIGLGLVILTSLSAWPVYHYGEAGYDRVLSMADPPGSAFLDYHEGLAERWILL